MKMNDLEIIKACLDLMNYAASDKASGADFDIDTPNCSIHFTYNFTVDLKNQEMNDD